MYKIKVYDQAIADLSTLSTANRSRVVKEIREQLSHEPLAETGRKKEIKGLKPPWTDEPDAVFYQLKIVPFRIFYEVHGNEVKIRLVRLKTSDKRTADLLQGSPTMTKRGYRTILIVRRGKLVPFEVDVRGLDEEQIALGLDDELHAEMQRRRSGGRSYTLDQACEILGIPSPTPRRRASKPNTSRPVR